MKVCLMYLFFKQLKLYCNWNLAMWINIAIEANYLEQHVLYSGYSIRTSLIVVAIIAHL